MDAPAGVTQEKGHTGLLHLPPAVLALIFILRRIQSSLSLVDREVELHFQQSRVWTNRVRLLRSADQEISLLPSPQFTPKRLALRDGVSHLIPRQPTHYPQSGRIWYLLAGFLPLSATASTNIPSTAIGSAPSLSDHTIACRKRLLPRTLRHRVSSPQDSKSKGYCLFREADQPILRVAHFSHLLLYEEGGRQSLMYNILTDSFGVSGCWGWLCLGFSRKTFLFVDCSLKQRNGNSTEIG